MSRRGLDCCDCSGASDQRPRTMPVRYLYLWRRNAEVQGDTQEGEIWLSGAVSSVEGALRLASPGHFTKRGYFECHNWAKVKKVKSRGEAVWSECAAPTVYDARRSDGSEQLADVLTGGRLARWSGR